MKNEKLPLVSILINNCNYGHFLGDGIDSALDQTYPNFEIIVVDDGSVDSSLKVISGYGRKLRSVFKESGGQASALNAGVEASLGEIIFFLDADDVYNRNKVEHLVALHKQVAVTNPNMISHRLQNFRNDVDGLSYAPKNFWHITKGRRSADSFNQLCSPTLAYQYACNHAFVPYLAAPTSGISMTRSLTDRVFPLPEVHEVGADCLLARASILMGNVFGTGHVYAKRRIHDDNNSMHVHKHLEDETFLREMDIYLNRLLITLGHEPVISFFESRSAERFHRIKKSSLGLLRIALKTCQRDRSIDSLRFALRQCLLAGRVAQKKYIPLERCFVRLGLFPTAQEIE